MVRVGRLGAEILEQQGRSWFSFSKSEPRGGCQFFSETGHNICGNMLRAWNAYGGIGMIGLPLSDERREMLEDSNEYTVQWFERARFQLSPGRGAPFDVELGRLGALDLCVSIPTPVNADLSPSSCLIQGVRLDLRLFNFEPNSRIQSWYIRRDGRVYPPTRDDSIFTADNAGVVDVSISGGGSEGVVSTRNRIDYFVYQGEGNHTGIVYFKVIDPQLTPAYTSVIHPCVGLPTTANSVVTPISEDRTPTGSPTTCALPGIEWLQIEAYGFTPGEQVNVRITEPDGTNVPQEAPLIADENGIPRLNGNLPRFRVDERKREEPGLYVFFIEGSIPQGDAHIPNIAVLPIMVTTNITPPPPPELVLADTPPITYRGSTGVGQEVTGSSAGTGGIHEWTFEGSAGQIITIRCDAPPGSATDPRVNLFGPAGNWLIADDDGGDGLNALIANFRLPSTGTYTIKIDFFTLGDYVLKIN